ncbi:hypothetical protein THRCLA_04864 [Thraustotheca clavata]|uniref:U-box domain-containing protein n=1 Tax=Thraustotheca clavata TaxID=74557 RepID=A0A1V9ZXS6_9STRA|nr:hypothetical protein THRCLA_04864 [Thraustotheca clavata]
MRNVFDEPNDYMDHISSHYIDHYYLPMESLDSFVCPITFEVMVDPVVAVDGHSYERAAIEQWFGTNNTSPATNCVLPSTTLVPNHALKRAIAEFRALSMPIPEALPSPVIAPPPILTRLENLPEVGYFIYHILEPVQLCAQPSLNTRLCRGDGEPSVLPANELVVVSRREYGIDTNHVFLQLAASNDAGLRGLYILESQYLAPQVACLERVAVVREIGAFVPKITSQSFSRPSTCQKCIDKKIKITKGQVISTNMRVVHPTTGVTYLRLEGTQNWIPSFYVNRCQLSNSHLVYNTQHAALLCTNIDPSLVSDAGKLISIPSGALVATKFAVMADLRHYVRINYDGYVGWCTLLMTELLPQCPPRLAEQPAGQFIPVAIIQDAYCLLVMNEIQENGSIKQHIVYSVPQSLGSCIRRIMATKRHITHAALGPNGEWYLSDANPDGTDAKCYSYNTTFEFQRLVKPKARVAFGDYSFLVVNQDGPVYECGITEDAALRLKLSRKIHSFGFFCGGEELFIKDNYGTYCEETPKWFQKDVLLNRPPKGYGALCSVSSTSNDNACCYVAIHEHNFKATNGVNNRMRTALKEFYSRHQEIRNARRQLISQYEQLISCVILYEAVK